MFHNFTSKKHSYLIPLSPTVQSDYNHGRVDQISITVEGKVCVLPRHVQHMPVKRVRQMFSEKCLETPPRTPKQLHSNTLKINKNILATALQYTTNHPEYPP